MYEDTRRSDLRRGAARLTQESFDLWRKYTQEYVAERASG